MIKKLENNAENFYCIAIAIYILSKLLKASSICELFTSELLFNRLISILRYISYIFLGLKFLFDKYDKKSLLKIILISCLSLFVGFHSSMYIFFIMLFIIGARNVDYEKYIKNLMILQITFFASILVLSLIKIIPDYIYISGKRVRHSLGLFYCIYPSSLTFFITFSYMLLRKNKMKIAEYLLLTTINIFMFMITNTRTVFIYSLFSIIIIYIYQHNIFFQKFLSKYKKLFVFVAPVCIGASLIMQYVYSQNNELLRLLNKISNNRLLLGHEAFMNYPIKLLGQNVEFVGGSFIPSVQKYNYVDSSFLQLLIIYGIIGLSIITILLVYTFYTNSKSNNLIYCIIMAIICMYCMFDDFLLSIGFNVFLLSLGIFFSSTENIEKQFYLCDLVKFIK